MTIAAAVELIVIVFVVLVVAMLYAALCAAAAADRLHDAYEDQLWAQGLDTYRARAKRHVAGLPRPDPARCGTLVRHPLPLGAAGQTTHVGVLQQLERNAGRRDRAHFPYS